MEDLASTTTTPNFLRSCYSYSNLFNLESLVNFRLPFAGDDPASCTSSSLDGNESKGHQRRFNSSVNGVRAERPAEIQPEMTLKRKRVLVEAEAGWNSTKREDEDSKKEGGSNSGIDITEEHYRAMLGDHFKRYRKTQLKEAISRRFTASMNRKASPPYTGLSTRTSIVPNGNMVTKILENGNETSADDDTRDGQCLPQLLDLGDGILLEIPPLYDQLAPDLHLPEFGDIQIDERILSGQLKSGAVFSMIASDPLVKHWKAQDAIGGIFDKSQFWDSKLDATSSTLHDTRNVQNRFTLQVFDSILSRTSLASSFPMMQKDGMEFMSEAPDSFLLASQQGSSITWRHVLSDAGILRQCEVKILERGDGYEVIERKVLKKESVTRDPAVVAREDIEKIGKFWVSLVRKDLPKHQKNFISYYRKQLQDSKKFAEYCQREVKYRGMRSLKLMKAAPMRIRKLARDMVIFWKKVDREQADLRKKEEKEAAEALKREEELREARRQQQRLNFLLTQTELYSHFMQNKMAGLPTQPLVASSPAVTGMMSTAMQSGDANPDAIAEDAAEEAALRQEALLAAQHAVSEQRMQTNAFDNECLKLRQASGLVPEIFGDMDLLNPSTMPVTSTVQQPTFFHGSLKEYQLKGLQWLVNCYEQGLNGILADEMGLGKTIQAMSFLAHLAEEKKIWGPFLVVAPASVLNNWADEVHRFCPDFKILPYWGGLQERTVLRKNISPKRLYRRDAVFHILITSYQLLVSDEKYLRRVKWQYMVLDEAQAIKSSSSIRWKTLLSFNCRNRLLLTGTPIQNNMAELWALLHFIMPTLFDSHEQFNEWFSKGIESHAEHGGTLNEHQLNRLHSILKPFMLRRVKKDVITEMTHKKEVVIPCTLSSRQQAFYQAIKNKISVADLFDSSGGHLNEKKVLNLMNIVIQLRKVCNHPELFERNEGHAFVQFAATPYALSPPPFGELECIHYAGGRNPISFKVPKLVYWDCMKSNVVAGSTLGLQDGWLYNGFNVFSTENVYSSIFSRTNDSVLRRYVHSGTFGFSRLADLSPSEVAFLAKASIFERLLFSVRQWDRLTLEELLSQELENVDGGKVRAVSRLLMLPLHSELACLRNSAATGLNSAPFEPLVVSHCERFLTSVSLLRSVNTFMPTVRAPQIDVVCSDRGFAYQREEELQNPWVKRLLVGFARTSEHSGPAMPGKAHHLIHDQEFRIWTQQPLLSLPYRIFGSAPPLQSFDFAKMLTDSGKLQTLDTLLKHLRIENHRILLFAQMTKMLNILEDYMNYRKYKYLRLDGSSTIMDRRDMVNDFQHRSDIFVFLLSTRAGGLGINLTAADTVIFYESDWNPTMDLQAMDRAHRLGQTKEVTVYRLICKGTVEEKIVKRANQKNTVQQLVMTGGHSQGDVFEADEVVSLLLDDTELEQRMKEQVSKQAEKLERRKKGWGVATGGLKAIRLDAEGGDASLEEVKNCEQASDAGDSNIEKGTENGGTHGKQRQGKKRHDGEGRPPKPPKAPKVAKGSMSKKDNKDTKSSSDPKDLNPSRYSGKSQKSASLTMMTNVKPEALQLLSNGGGSVLVDHGAQSRDAFSPFNEGNLTPSNTAVETSAEIMEDGTTSKSWSNTQADANLEGTDIGAGREEYSSLLGEGRSSEHAKVEQSEAKTILKTWASASTNSRNDTIDISGRAECQQFNLVRDSNEDTSGLSPKHELYNDQFQPLFCEKREMPPPIHPIQMWNLDK